MDISSFWAELSSMEKFYWIIALPSTIIFLIQLVLMFVGGDSDADGDVDGGDFDGDHGSGVHIFSVKSVVSFLMFFGWSGLAAAYKGIYGVAALGISAGVGIAMMFITAWVFFLMLKLQQSGTMRLEDAIGKTAEVYLTIPAKKAGNGKVEILIQEGLKTLDAVTEEAEDIKTGSFVEVVDIVSDLLVVKRKR